MIKQTFAVGDTQDSTLLNWPSFQKAWYTDWKGGRLVKINHWTVVVIIIRSLSELVVVEVCELLMMY